MSTNKIRLAISGFPGTGKTTLAHALGKRLNITVIKEKMSDIAVAQRNFMLARGLKDAADMEKLQSQLFESFLGWDKERKIKYAAHDGFVADRWQADLLELWLLRCSQIGISADSISSSLLKSFQDTAKIFDLVIVTPMAKPFAVQDNEQGISRNISMTAHVLSMALVMGLMQNFAQVRLYNLPNENLSVDERVDAVMKVLKDRRLI